MAIKVFDSQDTVPENIRASAVAVGDKWVVEEVDPTLGDAGKAALEKERTARKAADDARKALETELANLKREAEARASGVTEEQLKKIRDDEALARKPLEEERDRLAAELRQVKLTDRVKTMALAAGVMPDRIAKAMRDLEGRVDLTADGNSIVVKDATGNVTAETPDEFFAKTYKAEAPFFYSGTGSNGGGSPGSEGAGGDAGGYDPVKAGKAAAAEQLKGRKENELAFK